MKMKPYVLDTSALVAYIENEAGAEEIEALFQQALQNQLPLFFSVLSSIEVFYSIIKFFKLRFL